MREFASARDAFRADCLHDYQVMPLTPAIIDLACVLLEQHPLRAMDTAHLATALSAQRFLEARGYSPLNFVSADDRLNLATRAEGLAAANPSQYP